MRRAMSPAICLNTTVDCDDVLLVLIGTDFPARDVKFAGLVLNFDDVARDRRAIDVDVEDIEENANAIQRGALGFDGDYPAVGRRYGDIAGGNGAVGVAEEVETEGGQQPERRGEPRARGPGDETAGRNQGQRVIDAIEDDHQNTIFPCGDGSTL